VLSATSLAIAKIRPSNAQVFSTCAGSEDVKVEKPDSSDALRLGSNSEMIVSGWVYFADGHIVLQQLL
jgi:hypothetical protein